MSLDLSDDKKQRDFRPFDPSVGSLFQTTAAQGAYLDKDEPLPFKFTQLSGRSSALLICDHAGRAVPRRLANLGVDPAEMERHIAYDIGAEQVTYHLAEMLDAPAVLSSYSRLVIDPNRRATVESSIPAESDGTAIPANRGLTADERQERVDALFKPYHGAVARLIEARIAQGIRPIPIFLHSFTPIMKGQRRPWEIGILWDSDQRLALPLIEALRGKGLTVGDNEPYSGSSPVDFSLHAHGQYRGLPPALIEIRQDLIDRPSGAAHWAEILAGVLAPLLKNLAD